MPISRFKEVLPILQKDDGTQLGICAMGPIGPGDKLVWMRVWAWQQDDDAVPASSGNAGDHVPGAHPLKPDQKPPFTDPPCEKGWMVQTALEEDSPDFNHEKPVLVQAIALVENGGESNIVQWSQAVALREPHPHGGEQPGGEHDHG
jgi:hypothetical protein